MSLRPLSPTHSIPDDVLASHLDFPLALGIIESWSVQPSPTPGAPRIYTVTFPDGQRATWPPSIVLAFGLGVRLAARRETP
jgi:hypothetical protein